MPSPDTKRGAVADAPRGNWVDRYAPEIAKALCAAGALGPADRLLAAVLALRLFARLAAMAFPAHGFNWLSLVLMFVGAIVMRGAGCTLNDIVDADLDAQVERTRSRPIPADDVTKQQAALFLSAQLLIGFVIVCQFNWLTIGLGALSLVLVGIYPFMKRITWWPQLFLGPRLFVGSAAGLDVGDRQPRLGADPALCRLDPLGHRLRHHLCAAGYRGRRADRHQIHRAAVRP